MPRYLVTTKEPGAYRQNLGFFKPGTICDLPEEDEYKRDPRTGQFLLDGEGKKVLFISSIPSVHWKPANNPKTGEPDAETEKARLRLKKTRLEALAIAKERTVPKPLDAVGQLQALIDAEEKEEAEKAKDAPDEPPKSTVTPADEGKQNKSGRASDKKI